MFSDYRVKKHNDKYLVQKYHTQETGMLWWKKTTGSWFTCDLYGNSGVTYPRAPYVPKYYTTFDDAVNAIKKFSKEPTYTYFNNAGEIIPFTMIPK